MGSKTARLKRRKALMDRRAKAAAKAERDRLEAERVDKLNADYAAAKADEALAKAEVLPDSTTDGNNETSASDSEKPKVKPTAEDKRKAYYKTKKAVNEEVHAAAEKARSEADRKKKAKEEPVRKEKTPKRTIIARVLALLVALATLGTMALASFTPSIL